MAQNLWFEMCFALQHRRVLGAKHASNPEYVFERPFISSLPSILLFRPVFGVLCRFAITPAMGLVGIVINLNAHPLAVGVIASTRGVAVGAVGAAVELRSGTKVALGKTGTLMRSGEVLVLQIVN